MMEVKANEQLTYYGDSVYGSIANILYYYRYLGRKEKQNRRSRCRRRILLGR